MPRGRLTYMFELIDVHIEWLTCGFVAIANLSDAMVDGDRYMRGCRISACTAFERRNDRPNKERLGIGALRQGDSDTMAVRWLRVCVRGRLKGTGLNIEHLDIDGHRVAGWRSRQCGKIANACLDVRPRHLHVVPLRIVLQRHLNIDKDQWFGSGRALVKVRLAER